MPRDPLDRYYTPDWVADLAVRHVLPMIRHEPRYMLEPAVGMGAFDYSLARHLPDCIVFTTDIDPMAKACICVDYLEWKPNLCACDTIITNPPYRLAEQFARKALTEAAVVVFLVRLNWLSSKKRYKFFQEYRPSHVFVLSKRPSFTGDGKTDSQEYCYVVWGQRTPTVTTKMHWLLGPEKEE